MAKTINNEKTYTEYDSISYTANDNREFYVTDQYQLEQDDGEVKLTVYQFSDLYPIPSTDKIITDNDRIEIEKRAYARAIRMLKAQRPQSAYQFNITALPIEINVGDKIRLMYRKVVSSPDECGKTINRVIESVDEFFYLTSRVTTFDEALNQYETITLDRELRHNDFPIPELVLAEKSEDEDDSGSESSGNIGNNLGTPPRDAWGQNLNLKP